MKKILNLTQHGASAEQVSEGVIEPSDKKEVQELLTFVGMPTMSEVFERAEKLAQIAADSGCDKAMIGGAPYLMAPLHMALNAKGITPLYAFSERECVEKKGEDGSIVKTTVFRHKGFVG